MRGRGVIRFGDVRQVHKEIQAWLQLGGFGPATQKPESYLEEELVLRGPVTPVGKSFPRWLVDTPDPPIEEIRFSFGRWIRMSG